MTKKMVQMDDSETAPIAASEQPLRSGGPKRMRSMSLSLVWRRPKSGRSTRVDGPSPPCQPNDNAIDDSEEAHDPHDPHDPPSNRTSGRRRAHSFTIAFKGVMRRASTCLRDFVQCRRPSLATTKVTVYEEYTKGTTPPRAKSSGTSSDPSPPSVPFAGFKEFVILPKAGAAAKLEASVGSQTESLRWYYSREDNDRDRESGIGIVVSEPGPEADSSSDGEPAPQDISISRVDFVTDLPTELSIQLLAHLDAPALTKASAVSKGWRKIVANQHIWRESCLRETTATYATGGPIQPGSGLGVPPVVPGIDWKEIYRVKMELDRRWTQGLTRPVYLNGHTDSIYCLQFDEYKIVSGSRDKTIRIWDMHTFKCTLVIGPPEVINGESMLEDSEGELVHYASYPDQRRATSSKPELVSFPEHHMASILCLQYDDEILVTGSSDFTCLVYDVKNGYRPIRRLRHHSAAVLDLTFDKKHIVTCSKDVTICVWDRETGSLLRQLRGHTGPVNAVQMRGNSIVSCSGDFKVKLWNIDTGKNIREFVGHTKGLACSQFSEDGRYVASAGNDKVIRIWDANTGECVREMKAHENLVRSLHIDSVSGRLISGSYDTDIKVWDMETGHQLLDFPRWHASWVLSAKSDYRRIVSTGQDAKILIMDFGADVRGIEMLASER